MNESEQLKFIFSAVAVICWFTIMVIIITAIGIWAVEKTVKKYGSFNFSLKKNKQIIKWVIIVVVLMLIITPINWAIGNLVRHLLYLVPGISDLAVWILTFAVQVIFPFKFTTFIIDKFKP